MLISGLFRMILWALICTVSNSKKTDWTSSYQDLNALPCPSLGSPSMIQHARWHISCDNVLRIRSARANYISGRLLRFDTSRTYHHNLESWSQAQFRLFVSHHETYTSARFIRSMMIRRVHWDSLAPASPTSSGQKPVAPLQRCVLR